MKIVEEILRRRVTVNAEDPDRAYSELRELLEDKMKFTEVSEEKYFNDVDGDNLRSKIITTWGLDKYTREENEIFFHVDRSEDKVDVQIKAKLVTEYPEDRSYKQSLWYYAYRSLFDKFLYGGVRDQFKPTVRDRVDKLVEELRSSVGDYSG